jgi:TolB-like protein
MFQQPSRPQDHRMTFLRPLFAIALAVASLSDIPALAQQNDLKQIAISLARDINAGNRHTITVADFTDLQGNVTELGRFISEELSTQLVIDAKSFTVVERIQLAAILKEHQISISGLVDPVTIKKLGQFAGVDAIVTGTLVPFSDSVRLTAKVLDVSTAKVMAVSTADLPKTKAIDDLLSRGISSNTNASAASSGGNPRPGTRTAAAASLEQDEFQFTLKNCVRRGDHVLCSGSVTNKAEKARNMGIYSGQEQTTAIDNEGNSYISQQVSIGQSNGISQVQLMPELPMNFFLTFSAVEQNASTITVVLSYWGEGVNHNPAKVLFRNISLAQK